MESGIYKIYNKSNNKYYIGQSINIKNRLKQHKKDLRENNHINSILQNDYSQYGEDNFIFEPIHLCEDEFLNAMEKYYIDKYNALDNGYNIQNVITFVKPNTRKEIENNQLKKEFDKLNEITIEVPIDVYINFKFFNHMISLVWTYDDERNNTSKYLNNGIWWNNTLNRVKDCFKDFNDYEAISKGVINQLSKYKGAINFKKIEHFYMEESKLIANISFYKELDKSELSYKELIIKVRVRSKRKQ